MSKPKAKNKSQSKSVPEPDSAAGDPTSPTAADRARGRARLAAPRSGAGRGGGGRERGAARRGWPGPTLERHRRPDAERRGRCPGDTRVPELPVVPSPSSPSRAERDAPGAREPSGDESGGGLPEEEMGFSNSTLHWLDDGDHARMTRPSITLPSYDPTAPVAGRRRAIGVVGGAAIIALVITGALYLRAEYQRANQPPPKPTMDASRELTRRAEEALAANRMPEALELARLALVADPRLPDPHYIVATCERARNNLPAAREEFRKYLDLAPIGRHSTAARKAFDELAPP